MNRNLLTAIICGAALIFSSSMTSCHAHRSASTTESESETFTSSTLQVSSRRDTSALNEFTALVTSTQADADSVTLIHGRDSTVVIHIYRPRVNTSSTSASHLATSGSTVKADSTANAAATSSTLRSASSHDAPTGIDISWIYFIAAGVVATSLIIAILRKK